MRSNVRQLEAFKVVMDSGTISSAARSLNVSQPAITKSIRLLEQALRLRLFVRAGGRLIPSFEAKCLYPLVSKIFDDIILVDEMARQLGVGDAGTFRVAATFGHSVAFVPEAIRHFSMQHPRVDFRSLTLRPDQIMDLVASHDLDLGIVYQPTGARFRELPICDTDVVCVTPKDHPLAALKVIKAEDLVGYKIVSYVEQSHAGALLRRSCEIAQLPWAVAHSVNQTSTAISMVEAGLGVAVVDCLWIRPENLLRLAVLPFRPKVTLRSRVIYAIDRPFSKVYQEFVRSLSQAVRDRIATMPTYFQSPRRSPPSS